MIDALGISPNDLDEGGSMLNELNDIMNLDSHLYDNLKPSKSILICKAKKCSNILRPDWTSRIDKRYCKDCLE